MLLPTGLPPPLPAAAATLEAQLCMTAGRQLLGSPECWQQEIDLLQDPGSHAPRLSLFACRGASTDIAERNEEINRRRLARPGASGGPLRVTDPAALQRLMAEMKAKADHQRCAARWV